MANYLLDTNHATVLMGGKQPLTARMRAAEDAGDRFDLSITIVGELYYAVYASQQREQNFRRLLALMVDTIIWPFDLVAAEEFGNIRAEQRRAGRPVPPLDTQIAAVARLHGLVLLTADRHFSFVADLQTENWLD